MTPIKRFKGLLKVDKKDIYQIFLYAILAGVVSLSLPLGVQAIVNFLQAGKINTSWVVLVIIVVAGVATVGVFRIMQYRITENLQQKIFVRSSFDFSYRFPKMKTSALHAFLPEELANRFFDTLNVQKGVSKILLEISGAMLQIFFGIILLSLYHSFFILFGIILIALIYVIFRINFSAGLETSLKESDYKYKVAHWIQEIARNHMSFKNKQVFDFSLNKNDELTDAYIRQREGHFKVLKKQFIQLTGFKVLMTAGLLVIGGVLVLNHQMNIGQFVAAEIVILNITNAVEKLFSGTEMFYDILASLEKIGKVVDIKLESGKKGKYRIDNSPIKIEMQSIAYKYQDAEKYALKNISMEIEENDRVLIEGTNGSGKTTLIRMLNRIISPTEGMFYINGLNYKNYSLEDYRSNIGTITANDNVFEGTIMENITCKNQKITMSEIFSVLDNLKLSEYIKSLPEGLETIIHTGGKHLSSSIIEKILIARCVLSNPRLIFLEEPLKDTDTQPAKEIIDYLTAKDKEWIIVVISKIPYWRSKCNKHFYMENGTIKS